MKLDLYLPLKVLPGETMFFSQVFGVNGTYYQNAGINIIGHNGLDIVTKHGQEVYAAHDGIITEAGTDIKGGIGVVIRTKEKYDYLGGQNYFATWYWHLENFNVKIGEEVSQGQLVGLADNTGFSTGDHLHFGLKALDDTFNTINKDNGYLGAIDPLPYLLINTMKHVLINGNQYLLYPPLKIAISIADLTELQKLTLHGLMSLPESAGSDVLKGYLIYPGIETKRLQDIFNF